MRHRTTERGTLCNSKYGMLNVESAKPAQSAEENSNISFLSRPDTCRYTDTERVIANALEFSTSCMTA